MYTNLINKISEIAQNKVEYQRTSPFKYLVSSAFAGALIGFGILLANTIGGFLSVANSPYSRIIMGATFAVALTLVNFIGVELFTGNNLTMLIGFFNKKIRFSYVLKIWVISYFGNLIGAIILSFIFVNAGLAKSPTIDFFASLSQAKIEPSFMQLFFRGILCNFMVCIAVLMCLKLEDDTAKILITLLCIITFFTSGFEHSIANMTTFGVTLVEGSTGLSIGSVISNLIPVTLGNIMGGGVILGGLVFALRWKK